jgi:hypothetical protein
MSDHPPYSPDFALSNYHLVPYLKNWMESQCFSNNEELMESVKELGFAHRQQISLSQASKNLFLHMISASIPALTMLRSSLSMYIFCIYNQFFSSLLVLLTAHWGAYFLKSSCIQNRRTGKLVRFQTEARQNRYLSNEVTQARRNSD